MNEIRLLEYLDGKLDQDEALEVEAWVNESPENRTQLEQIYYLNFVGKCVAAQDSADVDRSFAELQAQIQIKEVRSGITLRRRNWRRILIPVAAFLTGVICTISLSFYLFNDHSKYIVATATGQRAQFVLPDGSRVWLNSSSELTYNTSFWSRTRDIDLEGEAYFEVEPNKRKPFIVSNRDIHVQVLGTKFNVRARESEDRVVTTLLSGSVQVDIPTRNGEEVMLKPGEILEVNTKTLKTMLTKSASANDVLLWMDGRLKFKQASLEEMTSCFEKHFDVRFHFADSNLKQERFTCEFSTDSNISDILSILELTNRFQYQMKGNQVYLSVK